MDFVVTTNMKKYDLDGAIKKSLTQSSLVVHGKAVKNAPYQTGNLRRSLNWKIKEDTAIVGTNVKYAKIREYVNKKNPSRRFYMKRALESSYNEIKRIFTKNIKNVLDNK